MPIDVGPVLVAFENGDYWRNLVTKARLIDEGDRCAAAYVVDAGELPSPEKQVCRAAQVGSESSLSAERYFPNDTGYVDKIAMIR